MTDPSKPRWSTGREDTRAIFRDGQCMGRMNEVETAAVVVRVMNGQAARVAEVVTAHLDTSADLCPAATGIAAGTARCPGSADGAHRCSKPIDHLKSGEGSALERYDHPCFCGKVWSSASSLSAWARKNPSVDPDSLSEWGTP